MRAAARRLLLAAVLAVVVAGAAGGGLGWHVAERIHREAFLPSYDATTRARFDDADVRAVDSATITLAPARNERGRVERDGTWGVVWRGGGGSVGEILDRRDGAVTRRFTAGSGRPQPGDSIDVRFEPYDGDPRSALGLGFVEVAIPSPAGLLPAWEIPGSRDVWAVCVHGKGAGRVQMLREAEQYAARGFPVLVPSYRNDLGAPPSPDGRYHYGLAEWRDLEAAVRHARTRGARAIVLHGVSMGGGIVVAFLERSPQATAVAAVVLDSPMLDFGATVDWGIARARVPLVDVPFPPLAGALGKAIVAWRDGVDWSALDHLARIDAAGAPILVLHGDDDGVVPPATSRRLAARLPDRVSFVRFPGADHGEAWNVDRARYERALGVFLERAVP